MVLLALYKLDLLSGVDALDFDLSSSFALLVIVSKFLHSSTLVTTGFDKKQAT